MRYEFIEAHRGEFEIVIMCRVLGVSRSGYYAWRKRPVSRREMANEALTEKIRDIHQQSDETYGSPRIHAHLADEGLKCGVNRVARLMREAELMGQPNAKFKVVTTDSQHAYPVSPNLLGQDFTTVQLNEKWLSDITYIPTDEGWLYLALVMDLHSRRIIGWAMDDNLERGLAIAALQMALNLRQPSPGLIHHSDRGSQYASHDYQALLTAYHIQGSMSRKGNCYDNAPMESCIGTLKTERVHRRHYLTRAEAKTDIFEYIEVFYNRFRRHSALGYQNPVAFEQATISA